MNELKEFETWLKEQPKQEFAFEKGEGPTKEYVFCNVMEHIKNEIVFVEGNIHLWQLENAAQPEFVIEMEEYQAIIYIAPSKEYRYGYIVSVFSRKKLKLRNDGMFPHTDEISFDMISKDTKWEETLEAYQKNKKRFSLSLQNEFQLYAFLFELITEIERVNQKA